MKQIKFSIFVLLMAFVLSILIGCSGEQAESDADVAATAVTDSAVAETSTEDTDSSEAADSSEAESSEDGSESDSFDGPPAGGMMGGGAVDKSGDTVLQALIAEVEGKFQQFEYTDLETGLTVPYNLYIPEDYDASQSYPLVTFIADSSVVGDDLSAPLTQGYGALVWATDEEQAKHASFVLVPVYPEVIIDDHGSFTTTDYVELTVRLLDSVTESYSIDTNRLYATGQSMGGMTFLLLSAQHPDLFAAELFVSCQWDVSTLGNLASQTLFYIAAEGDEKASAGQVEVKEMLDSAGASYSTAVWNATWSSAEFDTAVTSILSEGNDINFATFELGTVLPEGVEVGTSEHMYSFDYAYKIEAVRDWLFEQTKATSAEQSHEQGAPTQANADARANLDLGIKYFQGTEVEQDYTKAAEYFTLAWEQGEMKAPRYLGIMYEEGLGVEVDYAKAYDFYKAASDAGDITAADRIGALYEEGLGVEQSYEEALNWYLIAAPSPEEAAQNAYPRIHALVRLGYFYENGLGVEQDIAQAIAWYQVAASDTHEEAEATIEEAKAALERLSNN